MKGITTFKDIKIELVTYTEGCMEDGEYKEYEKPKKTVERLNLHRTEKDKYGLEDCYIQLRHYLDQHWPMYGEDHMRVSFKIDKEY